MSLYVATGNVMNNVIKYFLKIFKFFVCLLYIGAPLRKRKYLPPIKSEILRLSACQLAEKLKNKELTSVEIIETYINRIKEVNPIINSVVQDRFDDAIKEAQEVDKILSSNDDLDLVYKERPLLGVPLSVKETIAVEGMSNNGARSRVHSNIAKENADIVHFLRKAGAIPLVVTNTPELCLYFETNNAKTGRTLNPYDTRRTPGGSSGGEAALLASAGSVIGVGSDIAGSIRFPAMFCGLFGHKPTPGYIPNKGHVPTSTDPDWDKFFTLGPLTRFADDLHLMVKIMTNKTVVDNLRLEEPVDVSKLKIYYMYGEGPRSLLQDPPSFVIKKAVKGAVDSLVNKFHCKSEKVDLRCARNSMLLATAIMRMRGIENVQQYDDEKPDDWGILRAINVIYKKLTFQSTASYGAVLWGLLKYFVDRSPSALRNKTDSKLAYCRKTLKDLLKDDAVLIYPTFPWEAPYYDTMSYMVLNVSYCTLFTTTGLPVSQVPVSFTKDNLPVGVQIVAGPHQDRLCLAVAKELEKIRGGWKPPPAQK